MDKEWLAIMYAVKKFRPYLYGRFFEIYTDHRALVAIPRIKPVDLSGWRVRWIDYLSQLGQYNYVVKYRSGKENQNADALSRAPIVGLIGTMVKPIKWSEWRREQLEDLELARLINHLEGRDQASDLRTEVEEFVMKKKVLYKLWKQHPHAGIEDT